MSPWPGPARPSPLATASHPPPLGRRTSGACPAPAATRRPPPASADTQDAVYECHALSLVPLSLSPLSPCPSPHLALSPSPPERSSSPPSLSTTAIDPLSSLRRVPEHRRRLPLPHGRATTPRTHCNAASSIFFHLGPPRSPATVRRP